MIKSKNGYIYADFAMSPDLCNDVIFLIHKQYYAFFL